MTREQVFTLKTDYHYWPTGELLLEDGEWRLRQVKCEPGTEGAGEAREEGQTVKAEEERDEAAGVETETGVSKGQ